RADPAQCPDPAALPRARCASGIGAALPQGSLAPVRVLLSRSIVAYSDPIRRSRRHAAISRPRRLYAAPLLCGAPRRPARPSLLSLPSCPRVPSTLRRWVRGGLPVVHPPRCQTSSCYDRVATHECPSLPAIPDGVMDSGPVSFASFCGPRVCSALLVV